MHLLKSFFFSLIVVLTACSAPRISAVHQPSQEMPKAMVQTIDRLNQLFSQDTETRLSRADSVALDSIIDWVEKHPEHSSSDAMKAYQMRGAGLETHGQILEAEPDFETALAMSYKLQNTDSLKLLRGNIASFLFYSCWQQGDYEGALGYTDLCLKEYEAIRDTPLQVEKNYYLMQSYSNQASIFTTILQPKMAQKSILDGRTLLANVPQPVAEFMGFSFLNFEALADIRMVDSLGSQMSVAESDSFANEAIRKWASILQNPLPNEPIFSMSGHMADAYLKLSQPLGEDSILKCISRMDTLVKGSLRLDMSLRELKSTYSFKFSKWQQAETEINNALVALEKQKRIGTNLNAKTEYPRQYLTLLTLKINLYERNPARQNEADSLVLADLYSQLIHFFDNLREKSEDALLFRTWTDKYLPYFQKAAKLCHHLFETTQQEQYLRKMLEYSERGRHFILRRNIVKKREENVEVMRVRQRREHFEQRRDRNASDKNAVDSLKYYVVKDDSLTKLYPDITAFDIPRFETIRQKLTVESDVAFIELTAVSAKELVGLVITRNDAFSFQSDSLAVMLRLAEQLESADWQDQQYTSKEFGHFHAAQYRIYQLLLENVLKRLPKTITRLVIVPDSKLAVLPFAALLTQPIKGAFAIARDTGVYLVEKYALTIMPSFNVYAVLPTAQLPTNTKVVGLSACFDSRNAMNEPLIFLDSFAMKQAGTNYYKVCDKKQILTELGNIGRNGIPIIVAHGDIRSKNYSEYGFRLSNTDMFNASDIIREKFNFSFTVLAGSCNTASGVELRGEGLATLSRSFMQAGVSSLLATTIDIKEKETAQLLGSFFGYYLKPEEKNDKSLVYMPKDIALQKAQCTMIKEGRHPIQWAHVVLIGDFSPLR